MSPDDTLLLMVFLVLAATLSGWLLCHGARPRGEGAITETKLHPFELAYLRGGTKRVAEVALATLIHARALHISETSRKIRSNPEYQGKLHPVEEELRQRIDGLEIRYITILTLLSKDGPSQNLKASLIKKGCLPTGGERMKHRCMVALPTLAVAVLGFALTVHGELQGLPTEGILVCSAISFVATIITLSSCGRLTSKGAIMLKNAKQDGKRLKETASRKSHRLPKHQVATLTATLGLSIFKCGQLGLLKRLLQTHKVDSSAYYSTSGYGGDGTDFGGGGGDGGGGGGGD
ncbi:MAG: TIGR04222 domain-containing membrane protein [Candidatus Sumerlaeia bacterium]|nr:TIGR04222 domain-containing membrane protein [Candidatus Sumerlaeia bacterium]